MKQKELQKQIEKDLDKLGNKYSEMGDEQELFFYWLTPLKHF